MRSAVALELVARKVWALLDAVQPLVGSTASTARVHPAWVRRHGLARQCRFPPRLRQPCGREELRLSCLGVGPTRKPVLKGRLNAPF